jgi:hypothetical protein
MADASELRGGMLAVVACGPMEGKVAKVLRVGPYAAEVAVRGVAALYGYEGDRECTIANRDLRPIDGDGPGGEPAAEAKAAETLAAPGREPIETTLSDREAAAICETLAGEFPRRLAAGVTHPERFRAGPHRGEPMPLTGPQRYWLHKLALEELARAGKAKASPAAAAVALGDLAALQALFARAAEHLQAPKVRLLMPAADGALDPHAGRVVLAPRTRGARKGSVAVSDGQYGGTFYGWIDPAGSFLPSAGCPEAVKALLVALAADPAKVAGEHGRIMGVCCFCGQALTDERSTAVGYGPICAKHWALPWGDQQTDAATGGVVERPRRARKAKAQAQPEAEAIHPDVAEGDAFGRAEAEQEARAFLPDPDYRRGVAPELRTAAVLAAEAAEAALIDGGACDPFAAEADRELARFERQHAETTACHDSAWYADRLGLGESLRAAGW